MKFLLRNLISYIARKETLWNIVTKPLARISWFLDYERKKFLGTEENTIIEAAIDKNIPDLVVKNGVFSGMCYPAKQAFGSALFPKLLGSYEKEIQPIIKQICQNGYNTIVDIGCAEGYYAVGFAMKMPGAGIYAFDLNQKALDSCLTLAKLNQVESRVKISGKCDAEVLLNLASKGKTLIFCDCDSCEVEIFTPDLIANLSDCDFLIETHDCIDMNITTTLKERFQSTHNLQIIESINDIKKVFLYQYNEIEDYDLNTKRILLGERPFHQEWFYLTSQNK